MALLVSNGLRNKIMATADLKTLLAAGFIYIYDGTIPTTADEAISGQNLLVTISLNSSGTGINLQAGGAVGSLIKAAGETWSGVVATGGTASFYRHIGSGSHTDVIIQGEVGTGDKEMNLSSLLLSLSSTQTIDYYNLDFPTA